MNSKTLLFNFHSGKIFSKTLSLLLFFTFLSISGGYSQSGAALHFDGGNDNVTVANIPALQFGTSNLTFEAKIKLSGTQGNYAGIISKATSGANKGIQLVCVNNNLALEFCDGITNCFGVGNGLIGTTNLNNGAWHHVAVVVHRATNTIKLYVDGISEASFTNNAISTLDLSTTTSLFIGKERSNGIYFKGSIDETRIWNRALTQCEIQNNMNGELPVGQTGLLAYYQFNQGTASGNNAGVTSLTDSSGNNYNGTLNNFALTGATSNWVSPGGVTTGVASPVYNPITITAVADQALCNNTVTTPVVFSSSTTGTICGTTGENGSFTLTAPVGAVFTSIPFASYGTPNGSCGSFTLGSCHATNSVSVVSGLVLGQNSVVVPATNGIFGDPCAFTGKRLYVQAVYDSTVYNWTNDTPSIGLATNGTGNINAFTAVNTGSTPVVATITVTPTTNGCVGTPIQFDITVNPTPVAPTAASQGFCDNATVADLVAAGTSLQWYANASGGSALASTTALTTGTYYVTQTTGTCESPRTAATVTINTTAAAPTATTPQMFNTGTTVADLVATGTALNWYSVSTNGVALVSTTPLTTGLYYVSQTTSGCESTRTMVQVNINGAALDFDGSDDYVTCGNIMPATYTKEAWFYVSNLGLQNNLISGGNDGQHALYPSVSYGNRISAGHNGTWNAVQDPTPIVANTWYHVALTYDAATTTMKLYKNGVLVSTNTNVAPFIGGNALRIGSFDNGQNLLGGKIDEVRIWDRVLPEAEIVNNMNCELGSGQTGLMAHYKFNQGVDTGDNSAVTILTDSSGNTNTGTLNNFALTGATSNWVANGAVTTGTTCSPFLSTNNFEFSSKFSVYPNPSSDVFSINSDTHGTIVVYDLIGKIIKSETIDLGITKLDLSNYPSGIYLMKVTNDSNQIKTMKLIKQ